MTLGRTRIFFALCFTATAIAWIALRPLHADLRIVVWAGTAFFILSLSPEVIYERILQASSAALKHRRIVFTLSAITVFLLLLLTATSVLRCYPNSADEYTFLYQAETMMKGRLWNAAHPLQGFFHSAHIVERGGRLFGEAPPGWPLALALFMSLGAPSCLVNPILGVLSIAGIYLVGERLYGERVGILSALLVASTSYFMLNSASYFSHTLASTLLLGYAYCAICAAQSRSARDHILAGVFFGLAFITRPTTSILFGAPLTVYLAAKEPDLKKRLAWYLAGAAPFLGLLLFSNYATTGSAFTLPQMLTHNIRWGASSDGLAQTYFYLRRLSACIPAVLLLLYVAYLPRFFKAPGHNIAALFFALSVIGSAFYLTPAGFQYGARYYYEAFPFMVLFVASAVFKEERYVQKSAGGKLLFFLLIFGVIASAPIQLGEISRAGTMIRKNSEMNRLVKEEKIDNAIVFVRTAPNGVHILDVIRNDPAFSGPVLYARDMGKSDEELLRFYPGRNGYIYSYDKAAGEGALTKMETHTL